MTPIVLTLPIKTVSEPNQRGHWAVKHRRTAPQRAVVDLALRALVRGIAFPLVVLLTRIAPRALDPGDNLNCSMKGVRDGVADALGINDRDARVTWEYAQRRGKPKEYGVEIRISARDDASKFDKAAST